MSDFKTDLNPLIPIGRLIFTILAVGIFCFIIYLFIWDFKENELEQYLPLIVVLFLLFYTFHTYTKPFFKTTKNYIIKDNSIEEFNLLTSKTKSINKEDIKGFSTLIVPFGVWKIKEIIIYLKDGSKINIVQFAYFNFKEIESTLFEKKYNYLGHEEYDTTFFLSRIYRYDD